MREICKEACYRLPVQVNGNLTVLRTSVHSNLIINSCLGKLQFLMTPFNIMR